MKNIFFIILIITLIKWSCSICLIARKFKKISYVLEVVISLVVFYILYIYEKDIYFAIVVSEIEYLLSKVCVLLIIIMLKTISFKIYISVIRKTLFSKLICLIFDRKELCYKLRRWQKIDYGPRLKQGIPAMAKKKHKKTQVKFDRNGFPIFESFYTYHLPIKEWRKSRELHFLRANKTLYKNILKSKKLRKVFSNRDIRELKKGNTPDKYTWHHHQNMGKLQLVSRDIHSAVEHIGGYSIWGPK